MAHPTPPAIASSSTPVLVEGAIASLSVDLDGNLRTSGGGGGSTGKTDATQLFSGIIAATGPGAWIDTSGYSSLCMQTSGTGQFVMYAEVSNDQLAVDNVLILSRDEVSLLDNIDSIGTYTVRPVAKYIRFNITYLVGSVTAVISGRTHTGISGADMLSFAMDRNNNMPVHVSLDDMSLQQLNPSKQPVKQIGYYSGSTIVPINSILMTIDCTNYRALMFQYSVGTTGVMTPQWSNDGSVWFTATLNNEAQAGSTTMSVGVGFRMVNCLAQYFRLVMTTATTAASTYIIMYANPSSTVVTSPATQPVSGTVTANIGTGSIAAGTNAIGDVGVQLRATTGGHTYVRFIGAATTNLNALKASAGRLYNVTVANNAAYPVYCHFYNTAVGSVTVGTTATVITIVCPANQQTTVSYDAYGYFFSNAGWAVSVTKGLLDNDTTVTVANDFIFQAILA